MMRATMSRKLTFKRIAGKGVTYIIITLFALAMIFPLIWLFFASFKENNEIFGTLKILPEHFSINAYIKGWTASSQVPFSRFYANSLILVSQVVIFTLLSSSVVGFGFSRFNFPLRKILFALMISGLMIPSTVLIIPRFILFRSFNWINTYYPFTIPALMANNSFFIFLFVQFFRGVPKEYDESAFVDGAGSFCVFWKILLPLSKSALLSTAIFQFMWTWNDFINPLIYINSVKKFPISLGLKMTLDTSTNMVNWNQIIAMAVLAMIPNILVFLVCQKHFVKGIAMTGIKG